eukprot:COSAG01_NODE_9355_length_2471_cov_23.244941_4_plen_45_part_01
MDSLTNFSLGQITRYLWAKRARECGDTANKVTNTLDRRSDTRHPP